MEHLSQKGFWSLICDDETALPTCTNKIESMIQTLSQLQEKMPELFPIPPKAIHFPFKNNLKVFISDDSEEEIKRSAEAIRSCVDFPFIMYFLKKDVAGSMKYLHTPSCELYKLVHWHNPANCHWELISKKTEPSTTANYLVPSQVTARGSIHLPADEKDFEMAANENGGKWILNGSDWEALDNLWKNLIRLYDTGALVAIKSYTLGYSATDISPVVMCYTADADCKFSVKKAAESIFICTGYDFVMYYKSNKSSLAGEYRHEGHRRIAKYMYTSAQEMYEKDQFYRWKKINFDEENAQINYKGESKLKK